MRGQGSEFLIHLNVNTSNPSNKKGATYHSIRMDFGTDVATPKSKLWSEEGSKEVYQVSNK
eukprot:scaffold1848_cov228-Alexandrium_tamarense.AAC.1